MILTRMMEEMFKAYFDNKLSMSNDNYYKAEWGESEIACPYEFLSVMHQLTEEGEMILKVEQGWKAPPTCPPDEGGWENHNEWEGRQAWE